VILSSSHLGLPSSTTQVCTGSPSSCSRRSATTRAGKRAVADLKDLQDVLRPVPGRRRAKRTLYAEQMRAVHAPTMALLAMGELVAA
jgi:hypothetical protein